MAISKLPKTAAAAFKRVVEILELRELEIPRDSAYNGSGGPGRVLEDLLGIDANNSDSLDFVDFDARTNEGRGLSIRNHETKFRVHPSDIGRLCKSVKTIPHRVG